MASNTDSNFTGQLCRPCLTPVNPAKRPKQESKRQGHLQVINSSKRKLNADLHHLRLYRIFLPKDILDGSCIRISNLTTR